MSKLSPFIKYTSVGIEMIVTIVAMTYLGQYLDGDIEDDAIPKYTIVFSLFGVFASLYRVYKSLSK